MEEIIEIDKHNLEVLLDTIISVISEEQMDNIVNILEESITRK